MRVLLTLGPYCEHDRPQTQVCPQRPILLSPLPTRTIPHLHLRVRAQQGRMVKHTFLLLLLASPALAAVGTATTWILPPGTELKAEQWLLPLQQDQEIADGWVLRDIGLNGSQVRLGVTHAPAEERAWLELEPLDSAHVQVKCPPQLANSVCQRVQTLLANRAPTLWQPLAADPPTTVPPLLRPPRPVILLLWSLLLLLSLVLLPRLVRLHPQRALGVLGLLLFALLLRLVLSPQTLLHEFYHSAIATEFLQDGSVARFGETVQTPALLLHSLTHSGMHALFQVNLLLAVLAVPTWMLLDAVLFGWRPSTWLTGILAAILPMFLRFSACEEPIGALALLVPLSLATWKLWLQTPRPLLLLISLLAATLAMLSRPEFLALPLLHLSLLLMFHRDTWRQTARQPLLWLSIPLAAWIVIPRLPGLFTERTPHFSLQRLLHLHALLNPHAALLLLPLLLVGLRWSWRHARKQAIWLIFAHLVLLLTSLPLFLAEGAFADRVQILPTLMLLPLMARTADLGHRVLSRGFCLLLAAAQFLVALPEIVRMDSAQQQEWQFVQDGVQKLPTQARLLARLGTGHVGAFPLAVATLAGKRFSALGDPVEQVKHRNWPPPGPDLLVYLGMSCWLRPHDGEATPDVARQACEAVKQHYTLEPLFTRDLAPIAYAPAEHVPAPPAGYTVGFYRATSLRGP